MGFLQVDYIFFALALVALDAGFMRYIGPLYRTHMGVTDVNLVYALLAYVVMALSWRFIQGDLRKAALMGLIVLGTYAFTLKAIFPSTYTIQMMLSETLWGTLVLFPVATWLASRGASVWKAS